MNIVPVKSNNSDLSPFDQIRHIDEQNNEYWLARELMPLLGYTKWQNFQESIERALTAAKNSKINPNEHFEFLPSAVKTTLKGGRPGNDYKLSRYGAYLTALNGDPKKEQIAQAQSYFVEKARQAEVLIPQQSERIRELELQNSIFDKQLKLRELDNTMLVLHGKETVLALRGMMDQIVETEKPTIEVIDAQHNVSFKGQTLVQVKEYALKRYGLKFKTGADVKRFLENEGYGDLIAQTKRSIISDYIPQENLDRLYKILNNNKNRQLLLGE